MAIRLQGGNAAFGIVVRPTQVLSLYANTVEGLTALRAPGSPGPIWM